MKKVFSFIITIAVMVLLGAFKVIHSGGQFSTSGSPGEGNCSGCHGGGAAGATVSITSIPSFTNNNFDPSTTYTITITINHPSLSSFGFNCEILGAGNVNSGLIANGGAGVLIGNSGGRRNVTHNTTKNGVGGASWTFEWTSPASGNSTIYVAGNCVNSDGGTSGDRTVTGTLALLNINTNIKSNTNNELTNITLSPNPSNGFTTLSYSLFSQQNITVDVIEISGKIIKSFSYENQESGLHANILDLNGISKGIYFVKTSANGQKISQKLISVQ